MKAFDLILNNTYLDQSLEENTFYFRIDFLKVIDLKKSMTVDSFYEFLQNTVKETRESMQTILDEFEKNEIEFAYADEQIWQNNQKDIVISRKGILQNVTDFKEILRKITEIKSFLLKSGIFLKIIDYVK